MIERCVSIEHFGWLPLREALWPHCSREEHLAEMAAFLAVPNRFLQCVAYVEPMVPVGLVEAALRTDYVNGTETSPVAFLEGLYVAPEHRRRGFAAQLVNAVAAWGASSGCDEIASDAPLDDGLSHIVHHALGFNETERVVFFRKTLR